MEEFPCARCGQCCRNVNQHEWYHHLDRGDGVCHLLSEESGLCTIYEKRPNICRIDGMYEKFFVADMSRGRFYTETLTACRKLRSLQGREDKTLTNVGSSKGGADVFTLVER